MQQNNALRGFAADHPASDLLRLKQVTAVHPLSDALVRSDGLVPHIVQACAALKPFLDYLNEV